MERKMNTEMFVLRSIACLSIALLHALYRVYDDGNTPWVESIGLLLTFGTPVFVFISQFVLSFAYPNGIPAGFWKKRIKYILLPYIFFGALYAVLKGLDMASTEGIPLLQASWYYLWRHLLLGDFHGYFILVIFQFYALYTLFQTYAKRFTPRTMLIVSFLINVLYLGFFNLTQPGDSVAAQYIWDKMYWIFSPGWIFYFTVAYYLGRNETWFREKLKQYRLAVYTLPILTGALVLFVNGQGWITAHSSKRIDMILFTLSMILFLFSIASSMRKVPRVLEWSSRYSFGIYLLHPLLLAMFVKLPSSFGLQNLGLFSVLLQFVLCVVGSAILMNIANRIPGGAFVVGRVGIGMNRGKKPKAPETPTTTGIGQPNQPTI
ncbi:membrane-bound acyltransferase YfiQ involved in biofilm formation [Paenibacillus anaericanus]|uniref:acyltransferase family protein n=1 Tax=Paenibacillus anaericanus TaxID=170367 RepID=UPI002788819C|nr:acyltransferase family protein [Paenibacillus anaericanus]MDQ0088613.1 membrane-bound acyltransferase YfiQ involved in biofilm formation [Paenibacillus anaericanus]